jgi:hypothetical protein
MRSRVALRPLSGAPDGHDRDVLDSPLETGLNQLMAEDRHVNSPPQFEALVHYTRNRYSAR